MGTSSSFDAHRDGDHGCASKELLSSHSLCILRSRDEILMHTSGLRKRQKLSQADVGKLIGINGDAYGRYERNDVKPTIEMATKIANTLKISLDYLVGKTELELDNSMLKRVEAVSKMTEKDKEHVFSLLDAFIAKSQFQGFLS